MCALVMSDVEDFLEFRLGGENNDDGVIRYTTSQEDEHRPAELIAYVSNQSGSLSRVSLSSRNGTNPSIRNDSVVSQEDKLRQLADANTSVTSFMSVKSEFSGQETPENKETEPPTEDEEEDDVVPPLPETPRSRQYRQNAMGRIELEDDPDTSQNTIHSSDGNTADDDDEGWLPMRTVGSSEVYDDMGNIVVHQNLFDYAGEEDVAVSGYTRVGVDDDAKSITSLDEKTDFLFEQEEGDAITQIQTTKEMLTESQKIAYVGLCRLVLAVMAEKLRGITSASSQAAVSIESLQVWGSRIIMRLYAHMELSNEEQLMIEQLAHHGVLASDLTPCLRSAQIVDRKGHITEVAAETNVEVSDLHTEAAEEQAKRNEAIDVRWTVLCDLFLNMVAESVYDARSRTMLELLAAELDVTRLDICQFERKVTDAMQLDESAGQTWEDKDIIELRRKKALKRKYALIGLATLGGGLVIGLSAGLLAPVIGAGIAAGLGTIGIGGTSGFLAGAGGAALITTTGVGIGARVGQKGMARRVGHVKTFEFRPLHNNQRVNVIVTVSGWMNGKEDDVRLPYSTVDPVMGDLLSVLWEPEMMQSMGETINILATEALTQSVQQILGATVLTALMASIQLPMALAKLSYLLDNPWNVSLDRAWAAGLILADTLQQRHLGARPVTLIGFSLGARVIYSCLVELARQNAFGIVQDVFIFGAPVVYSKKAVTKSRSVVSGRFVNGYSRKDWILGYLFRATSGGLGTVFGLAPINSMFEIENYDVTELVDGHMAYRAKMPRLLRECGYAVLSDEFDDFADPDPKKLRERQRKLIHDLNEETPKKKWWPWGRSGARRDKAWLDQAKESKEGDETKQDGDDNEEYSAFDVEAIREEVGRIEKLEVEMVFDADTELQQYDQPPPEYVSEPLSLAEQDEEEIEFPEAPHRPMATRARATSRGKASLHSPSSSLDAPIISPQSAWMAHAPISELAEVAREPSPTPTVRHSPPASPKVQATNSEEGITLSFE